MAVSLKNGWDFVKVGGVYQYKEDWLIAEVEILADYSDEKYYKFHVKALKTNHNVSKTFHVMGIKDDEGYYSGMINFYETPEYSVEYSYELGEKIIKE